MSFSPQMSLTGFLIVETKEHLFIYLFILIYQKS